MGEEEHGGGGWHDNLQQAGDLVAMATNKDVCIRGKSQRSAMEGTHGARLTVMENWSGSEMRKGGVKREECLFLISRHSLTISSPEQG